VAVEEIATLLQLYPLFGRPRRFVPDEQFTSEVRLVHRDSRTRSTHIDRRVRHKFNKFTMYSYDNAVPKNGTK